MIFDSKVIDSIIFKVVDIILSTYLFQFLFLFGLVSSRVIFFLSYVLTFRENHSSSWQLPFVRFHGPRSFTTKEE